MTEFGHEDVEWIQLDLDHLSGSYRLLTFGIHKVHEGRSVSQKRLCCVELVVFYTKECGGVEWINVAQIIIGLL